MFVTSLAKYKYCDIEIIRPKKRWKRQRIIGTSPDNVLPSGVTKVTITFKLNPDGFLVIAE